jgi:hypothetical protein
MRKLTVLFSIVILAFCAIGVNAQTTKKIGMKHAKEIASQQMPGRIKSSEREKEHGKRIYSFDIRKSNGGIMEVNIDAFTGAVIAVEDESAEKEAVEKAGEKAEKKKN